MTTDARDDDAAEAGTTVSSPPTRLWVLGSGSGGNAALVEHGDSRLLIDAGFEIVDLVARIRAADAAPATIDDVVLTHGHRDHVLGAASGARIYGWRLWATLGTVWQWRALRHAGVRPFEPGDSFRVGEFRIETAPTSHDVADSAAVAVEDASGARVGYATDLGTASADVERVLSGVGALVLEANYDESMLRDGPYPPALKARVAADTGHLGNAQAARLARAVAHDGLAHVVLAHVSRHNNTPALALAAVGESLRATPFRGALHAAAQDEVLGPLLVPAGAAAAPRPR
ncbi:MAG TPA: MBL fold metallo-hydrolase [Gemmatimonadaceae bacterium]|nr:MBL fold metallo-hydrolase [Gemmatimonadaceae bacterium]